jgi:hypothetical protein
MSCYIFKMVNMWNDAGADRSQPYADVTYTPGFEFNACDFSIADDHEHEQQPNSLVTCNVNIELYICANELQLVHLIH